MLLVLLSAAIFILASWGSCSGIEKVAFAGSDWDKIKALAGFDTPTKANKMKSVTTELCLLCNILGLNLI